MTGNNLIILNGRPAKIGSQKNLLELIRASGIDVPTFCYHSKLSVYGACRLCLVDIEGRGIVTSCTTKPESGMVVRTHTAEIRKIRKTTIELLLANHDVSCPTCPKANVCQLLKLADRFEANAVRYRRRSEIVPLDTSSPSLVRNPNKCILCGDCVRVCDEIQGIGVLDFAYRGSKSQVTSAFGQEMDKGECVNCGQCINVCPTGALTVKSEIDKVWAAIHDPDVLVIAQVAPAARIGITEIFGLSPGQTSMGQLVAVLKMMGVNRVYDTAFAADLTVIEETAEFLKRFRAGDGLPQFTSCCPAWVKFAEQRYPELLTNLSTCRSPQQMLGSLLKRELVKESEITLDKTFLISIMPCTAKKFEAQRGEFSTNGHPDVDAVLTTQEIVHMIKEVGLDFLSLEPERLDMPFGFKSGAGVLFGSSGGVAEAVLRHAGETLSGKPVDPACLQQLRGLASLKEAEITFADTTLRIAIVSGLAATQKLVEQIQSGQANYHLVEVMACPGGCIGGGGYPPAKDLAVSEARQAGIHRVDTMLQMHNSQDNPYLKRLYNDVLGQPNEGIAREILHTVHKSRRRRDSLKMLLHEGEKTFLNVEVCLGTSCHLKGGHTLLHKLIDHLEVSAQSHLVSISATFCHEVCDRGPTVLMGAEVLEKCTFPKLLERLEGALKLERRGKK